MANKSDAANYQNMKLRFANSTTSEIVLVDKDGSPFVSCDDFLSEFQEHLDANCATEDEISALFN